MLSIRRLKRPQNVFFPILSLLLLVIVVVEIVLFDVGVVGVFYFF